MDDMVIRYFKLSDKVIINCCETIDVNSPVDISQAIISNLLNGNLDNDFYSKELDGVEDKSSIHNLARKYHSLCFFQGNDKYWRDSVEGVTCQDLDTVVTKLLDNYNFLIKIAITNPSIFTFLTEVQDRRIIKDSSVIDYLRNRYQNDDILLMVLGKMADKNSVFRDYSIDKRTILCSNPSAIIRDNKLMNDEYIKNKFDSNLSLEDFSDKVFEMSLQDKESNSKK